MNMKKMLFMTFAFVFTFCLGLSKVYATEISVDDRNKIAMPVLLYNDSDEQLTLKGLDGATLYYQIVDVTNEEEIRSQIDEYVVNSYKGLFEANETLKNTSQDNSTEYANNKTNVIFYETEILSGMKKANLKTVIKDYNDASWQTLSNNIIPKDNLVKGNYYIVWIKAVKDSTTVYNYGAYKILNSGDANIVNNEVENPETGIGHTLLYVGVALSVVLGSALVINKNKESY